MKRRKQLFAQVIILSLLFTFCVPAAAKQDNGAELTGLAATGCISKNIWAATQDNTGEKTDFQGDFQYDTIFQPDLPTAVISGLEMGQHSPVFAVGGSGFPDVASDAWYLDDLKYILEDERGIFSGYPDGTFRPDDTLTVDMFIKLIVTVMGHEVENGSEYWASTYIEKAIEEGYVIPEEDYLFVVQEPDDPYYGYKRGISRRGMAAVTGRALSKITDESEYRDPLAVSSMIKDYNTISPRDKTNVVRCYDLGILTGYPDGEFKEERVLTRAEAVAVIRRLIDSSARKREELPVFPNPSPTPIPVSELNRSRWRRFLICFTGSIINRSPMMGRGWG